MAKIKILFAAALMMGFSSFSFAETGNPKDAPKANDNANAITNGNADVVASANTEVNEDLYYYKVTDLSNGNYTISFEGSNPMNPPECTDLGDNPCEISSTNPSLGTSVSKTDVDAGTDGIAVEQYQVLYKRVNAEWTNSHLK